MKVCDVECNVTGKETTFVDMMKYFISNIKQCLSKRHVALTYWSILFDAYSPRTVTQPLAAGAIQSPEETVSLAQNQRQI